MNNVDKDKSIPMLDKNTVERLSELFSSSNVILCYLYGSYARNQQTSLSDLDLAILLDKNSTSQERGYISLDLSNSIGKLMKGIEVDVRVLNDAPLEHRYNVVREGRVIYSAYEDIRLEFESMTLMRYFDFKPIIDQYYQYMYQRIEETGKI